MPRTLLSYAVDDVSALARSLRGQLAALNGPPGHVDMLNMLARAAGARNFQQFRANALSKTPAGGTPGGDPDPETPGAAAPSPAGADLALVERTLRHFDAEGRLATWPARTSLQGLALWGLWAQIPSDARDTEVAFNRRLNAISRIADPALLRRSMFNAGLVSRTDDCRDYRRIEQAPPPEARILIARLTAPRPA